MKFIVDAQLPKSLSDFLNYRGYDCIHTLELPDKNRTKDRFINLLAKQETRTVISKDNDFLEMFMLFQQPEKLILIKTGNIQNSELIKIFDKHLERIIQLLKNNSLIEVNKNEIIVHA